MNSLLNFVLLKTFVIVAETKNFTVASQHLDSIQSTLSKQIQRLETLTGQPLFARGHRVLTLTETGEILLRYAKKILTLSDTFFMKITGKAVIQIVSLISIAAGYVKSNLISQVARRKDFLYQVNFFKIIVFFLLHT